MKHSEYKKVAILFFLLLAVMVAGCFPLATDKSRQQGLTVSPTFTETQQPVPTISPAPCPFGTPEPLWVDPVTSPTDQLTQVVKVYIGNGQEVTIETESGTFTATGDFDHHSNPALVEITLLPNTIHHLKVTAKVRKVLSDYGDCVYGGYTLTATTDRNGAPLTIAQGQATP